MAILQGNYFSKEIKQDIHFFMMNPFEDRNEKKYLILLHGLMDNSVSWSMKTNLVRLAAEHGITVFCPEAHRSFYCDIHSGGNYRSMIIKEIPEILYEMFGIILNQNNVIIAGNSMGGYGALKAVLTPESIYKKCMAFSPVIHPVEAFQIIPQDYLFEGEEKRIFGESPTLKKEDDLYYLAETGKEKKVSLSIICGKNDFLIEQNRKYQQCLHSCGQKCKYMEEEGEHGWEFWNKYLYRVFEEF